MVFSTENYDLFIYLSNYCTSLFIYLLTYVTKNKDE